MTLNTILQALDMSRWYKVGNKLTRIENSEYKVTLEHFDEFLEFSAYDTLTITNALSGQVIYEFVETEALRDFINTRELWSPREWTEESVKIECDDWIRKQRAKCPKCNDYIEMKYLIDLNMCPDCYIVVSQNALYEMACEIQQPAESDSSVDRDAELAKIINQYVEKQ